MGVKNLRKRLATTSASSHTRRKAIPHQTQSLQLTPIAASWTIQLEVKGAPQIKCHTRRSVGPSTQARIKPEERSESNTFLMHNPGSKSCFFRGFVLSSSAPFDVFSLT
ncbi:hypothetical protein MHYP_G00334830 [Metynnis hypsauchen]